MPSILRAAVRAGVRGQRVGGYSSSSSLGLGRNRFIGSSVAPAAPASSDVSASLGGAPDGNGFESDYDAALGDASKRVLAQEFKHNAFNYRPLPVVLRGGKGFKVWDVEGNEYIDCMAAYGSVNQGHLHPKIVAALKEQLDNLSLASRGFYTDALGPYAELVTKHFGFQRLLPANTGVEAGETAVKLARRWGYDVKGIKDNCAVVVFPEGNFW